VITQFGSAVGVAKRETKAEAFHHGERQHGGVTRIGVGGVIML